MTGAAVAAVFLAALLDRLGAEPPASGHPVALFGRLVAPVDRDWDRDDGRASGGGGDAPSVGAGAGRRSRFVGVAVAVGLPLIAAAVAWGVVVVGGVAGGAVGGTGGPGVSAADAAAAFEAVAAGFVLFSATSLRMLVDVALAVIRETTADLDAARASLRALAGRDAAPLSAGEVRSAAVESAAENLADGLVAPLVGFVLLAPVSLPLAAAAAAWVKAVNTLDSMLGYRSKPVGRPSARLDDAVMWVPARASALLLAVAVGDLGAVARARRFARRPSSPNSGWPMATLAAGLDVRLSKPGHYDLAVGPAHPSIVEAERGVRAVARAGLLAFVLAGVLAWF